MTGIETLLIVIQVNLAYFWLLGNRATTTKSEWNGNGSESHADGGRPESPIKEIRRGIPERAQRARICRSRTAKHPSLCLTAVLQFPRVTAALCPRISCRSLYRRRPGKNLSTASQAPLLVPNIWHNVEQGLQRVIDELRH
jgi:hypothetical protein